MAKKLDIEQLKAFSPLDGLKTDNLHALLKKIKLERTQHGRTLFSEGDTEKYALYSIVRDDRAPRRRRGRPHRDGRDGCGTSRGRAHAASHSDSRRGGGSFGLSK
jgi:hypothetical protein